MPRTFYVVQDDRGRWAIANAPIVTDHVGSSFRNYAEAFDHLRSIIEAEGLVMGRPIPEGMGFRVEALTLNEAGPTLYSAEALKAIDIIKEEIGKTLQERAQQRARRDGRKLVTDGDVLAALSGMSVMGDLGHLAEENVNG